uniref:Uncharacterized protein n=1 Tax=Anguilla anguilla TaxID=7936 RepID=A0A0E9WFP9_ANGAN
MRYLFKVALLWKRELDSCALSSEKNLACGFKGCRWLLKSTALKNESFPDFTYGNVVRSCSLSNMIDQ